MDKPAQDSFTYALDNGINPQDAVTVAPQLANMSATATKAFYNDITTNGMSPAQALQTATQVNSLDPTQQAAYFNAASQGLDHTQALDVANNASMLGSNAQNTYIQSVKAGTNNELAQIVEATQQLVSPGSAVTNVNAPSTLTDPNAVQIYNDAIASGKTPAQAQQTALDYQKMAENVIAAVTGSGNAQASETTGTPVGTVTVTGAPSEGTAVSGTTSQTPSVSVTKSELDAALANGEINQQEYNAYLPNVAADTTGTQVATPNLQDILGSFVAKPTTTTVPGGASSNVTATIPGGAGSNVGTGTANVAGTGNGAGTTVGTGTGTGGVGVGTGTGIGTAGGTYGSIGGTYGTSATTGGGGLVNLVGGTTGGREITLAGLPTTQDTINPVASAPAPQSVPQMDPIFSKKGGKVKKKRKK